MGQAAFCGKATVGGAPCRNGPGCTAAHPNVSPAGAGSPVGPSAWPARGNPVGGDPLDGGVAARVAAAADPATDPVTLAQFAEDPGSDLVRFAALANPSTPAGVVAEAVEEMVGTGGIPEEHLVLIAANPSLAPDTLLWLTEAEHPEAVRVAAVRNRAMPVEAVVALAGPGTTPGPVAQVPSAVRDAAAERIAPLRPPPDTNSAAVAASCAADPDPARRYVAAATGDLPQVTIGILAADPDHAIRHLIARRADLPAGVIARLADDQDLRVAKAVARNPTAADVLPRLALHAAPSVRAAVAANPAATAELLGLLARDPAPSPRWAAARSPATPPAALAGLAASSNWQVRASVAGNQSTPPETLAVLAVDPNPGVRAAALDNPATPAHGRAAGGLLSD